MSRGAVTKKKSRLVAVWVPNELLDALDQHVTDHDLDRSKVIRLALKERLRASGGRRSVALEGQ